MSIIENIRNRSWVREKYEKEKDDCLRIRGRVDRKIVGAIETGRMADSDDRSCRDVMGGAGSVLGHYDTGRRVEGGVSMENERCLQAFREFAEWQKVPIIVILQQRDDRLEEQLLRAGAAECVCPEQSTDLAACRIARAVSKNVVSDVPMTEWERVIVDSEGGQVQIDGYPIHMSREECILLKRLLQAEGAVVYRDELVENLWSEVSVHSRRRLDGVVQRVRKRLYGTRLFIVSKYGKGYYLQYHKEENGSCFV